MGTHATVKFYIGTHATVKFYIDNKEVCQAYHQYDGYPEGVGSDLVKFLLSKKFTNGIKMGEELKVFNGAGDFIAQYVVHAKLGETNQLSAGGVYIIDIEAVGEEFHYIVHLNEKGKNSPEIIISVYAHGKVLIDKVKPEEYERVLKFLNEVNANEE